MTAEERLAGWGEGQVEGSKRESVDGVVEIEQSRAGSHGTPQMAARPRAAGTDAPQGGARPGLGQPTNRGLRGPGVARLAQSQVAPKAP